MECTFSHIAVGGVGSRDGQQLRPWEQMEGAKQTSSRRADILSTIESAGRDNIVPET